MPNDEMFITMVASVKSVAVYTPSFTLNVREKGPKIVTK